MTRSISQLAALGACFLALAAFASSLPQQTRTPAAQAQTPNPATKAQDAVPYVPPPAPYGIDAPVAIGGYLDGVLPTQAPGSGNTFTVEPAYPGLTFQDPLVYKPAPHTNLIAGATRLGVVWTF
ncbi:MAG: hypothetical protein P1V35_08080 [Planctomycetota bacterium]|nr:hypothetical protein [Planctomycetota bacterium]